MFDFFITFLNLFNISSLFSSRTIISSTFLECSSGFIILSLFDTVSAILFPKTSPALQTTFLEAAYKGSSPVYNNCLLHFLTNDKHLYPLTYFLVFGSIEYCCIDA